MSLLFLFFVAVGMISYIIDMLRDPLILLLGCCEVHSFHLICHGGCRGFVRCSSFRNLLPTAKYFVVDAMLNTLLKHFTRASPDCLLAR